MQDQTFDRHGFCPFCWIWSVAGPAESLGDGREAHVSPGRDLAVCANLRRKRGVCFRDGEGSENVTLTDADVHVQDDLAGLSDHGAEEMDFFALHVHVPTLSRIFHHGLETAISAFESDLETGIDPTVSCLWNVAARDGLGNEIVSCQMATCDGPLKVAPGLRRPFLLFEGYGHVVTFWGPAQLAMGFDYVCACSSLVTSKNHVGRHGPEVEGDVVSDGHVRWLRRPLCLSTGQDFDGVGPGISGRRDHEARGSDLCGCCAGSLCWSDGEGARSDQNGRGCDVSTGCDGDERAGRRKRAVQSTGREICRICCHWGRLCCCHWGDLGSVCVVELLGQEQDQV